MLGGGNPAHIPEMTQLLQQRFRQIAYDPVGQARIWGDYDPPQGNRRFIASLAAYLRKHYGWDIGPENIALTAGSQTAFYMLFNLFSGEFEDGTHKKILLPMAPEYIGYADVCHSDDVLVSNRPLIEYLSDHEFKYHIDFDQLRITEDIGAICISRPSNPTGNVITDDELDRLMQLSAQHSLPLIIDNAYGMPFPGILYTPTRLRWEAHVILCMSLSKLGLPGVRTGIVIAKPEIIRSISRMNAVFSLAPGGMGPAMMLDMVETSALAAVCDQVIRPYYQHKASLALSRLKYELSGIEYYVHRPEGAFFLWLWIPGLPGGCENLYKRLKQRSVLVVPGHYFFAGLEQDWPHRHECLRISYAMDDHIVQQGLSIIADEIRKSMRK